MKALSFTQPWLWAILHGGKRIENRVAWKGCDYRGPILLHAAKSVGSQDEFNNTAQSLLVLLNKTGRVGIAERFRGECIDLKVDLMGPRWVPRATLSRGGIVGRARIDGVLRDGADFASYASNRFAPEGQAQRAWWFGGFALVLADVEPLPFVPWKGALGLFEVPEDYATRASP
jgi:hypothetical protein